MRRCAGAAAQTAVLCRTATVVAAQEQDPDVSRGVAASRGRSNWLRAHVGWACNFGRAEEYPQRHPHLGLQSLLLGDGLRLAHDRALEGLLERPQLLVGLQETLLPLLIVAVLLSHVQTFVSVAHM